MYLTSIRKQKCACSWFLRQTGYKERMDIIKLIKSHSESVVLQEGSLKHWWMEERERWLCLIHDNLYNFTIIIH